MCCAVLCGVLSGQVTRTMLRVCATRVLCHVTALFCVLPYFFNRDRLFANAQCATFDFPDFAPGSDKLTVKRGADIHFLINTASCPDTVRNSAFTITIAKKRNDGIDQDVCKMSHTQGKCSSFRTQCQCPNDKGRYYVLNVTSIEDETSLIWKATPEQQRRHFNERIITLELQYPVSITKLSLRPSDDSSKEQVSFTPGSSVDILCTFEAGKPMGEPVLRKSWRVLEADVKKTGEKRHRIPSVRCEDSGMVWCRGGEESQNQSAPLLVECPPVIVKKSVSADKPDWEFHGKSYSPITRCSVVKHAINCLSNVEEAKGGLPDFVLTLARDSLLDLQQEGGSWTLTLENDLGPANFTFSIPGPNMTREGPTSSDQEAGDPSKENEDLPDYGQENQKVPSLAKAETDRRSAGVMSAAVDVSAVVICIAASFWSWRLMSLLYG